MIEVEGLTKDYGSRRAIDNLTFNAKQGEVLGFLGPNGAGKTTTMRILTGYMPPTFGEARVAGFDVVDQSLEVRKRVGYLPETVPLYNDMTVYDYLRYMADLRHLDDADDRVLDVLGTVHMEERSEGYISNLSKGMRQRVGLAQALLHQPEVLILDEPTIGLDPAQIIEVRSLIREIGKERTVLLSTHILSEAQQLCDRVMIINKGRIVAEDSPEHLQNRLAGAQRVALRVVGDGEGLEESLGAIPGVLQVKTRPDGMIEIESAPGADTRPLVARSVIEAGHDLLELHAISLSLEDIFIQLTREEPAPPEIAEMEDELPGTQEEGADPVQETEEAVEEE
ncbi:MAG: ABC transporter ATP-binding protein [Anaerolineales bacterium]|nr:ABC transporter ATP-binding protein [Anaerolineales bacterium]